MPMQDGQSAIRTDKATRHYRLGEEFIRAGDEVSFEVRAGEFLALLGSSGSGNETLLILLADEPSGHPASANGEQMLTPLAEINQSLGMTIVMVTHERALAERFADRVAVMSDRKLIEDGVKT